MTLIAEKIKTNDFCVSANESTIWKRDNLSIQFLGSVWEKPSYDYSKSVYSKNYIPHNLKANVHLGRLKMKIHL